MINILQAAVLGLLQGITELFPISSLGHSVILPTLLGWNLDQQSPAFLTFLVATHLATAVVLFIFFIKDWVRIFKGLGRSLRNRRIEPTDTYAKLGWLLVAGTVPAGILGLLLEKPIRSLFASPLVAAALLAVNGLVLLAAERLRRRNDAKVSVGHRHAAGSSAHAAAAPATASRAAGEPVAGGSTEAQESDEAISRLSWKQALGIGAAQAAALVPGISRSGSSMVGGLLSGLSNEDAARFSFLLATPIIGAAAVLKLPELFSPVMAELRLAYLVGALCSAVAAWFSTRFLLRYFEHRNLVPFAVYCLVGGAIYFALMAALG